MWMQGAASLSLKSGIQDDCGLVLEYPLWSLEAGSFIEQGGRGPEGAEVRGQPWGGDVLVSWFLAAINPGPGQGVPLS